MQLAARGLAFVMDLTEEYSSVTGSVAVLVDDIGGNREEDLDPSPGRP